MILYYYYLLFSKKSKGKNFRIVTVFTEFRLTYEFVTTDAIQDAANNN